MSENKWTSGPYVRVGQNIYALEDAGRRMKTNRFYAFVDRSGSKATAEELEAVAQLWVAAPAMAEALENLLKVLPIGFAATGRPGASDALNTAWEDARNKAEAALSLARGEAK